MKSDREPEKRFAELVSFIRDTVGEYEMPITRETLIEDDLGVSGDEADRLVIEASKKYNFSIKDFNFAKYFNDEPSLFAAGRKVYPFKVGYLEKAIITGRLDEEVINS